MWPFKTRKHEVTPEPLLPKRSIWQDDLDKLAAWRKPGETFSYLGIEMVVTATEKVDVTQDYYPGLGMIPRLERRPAISARYVNKVGEICYFHVDGNEAMSIATQA